MYNHHDSVSLDTENQLASLRGQISEIKAHIDLLMMQSAVIRERRCLLQQQQGAELLTITKRRDQPCPETSSVNFLDMEENIQDSVVLGGADDLLASLPSSRSIVTIPSDNSVVVQTPTKSRGGTSKLSAKPGRYKPGRHEFQGMSARHEPPALFQGWLEVSGSIF